MHVLTNRKISSTIIIVNILYTCMYYVCIVSVLPIQSFIKTFFFFEIKNIVSHSDMKFNQSSFFYIQKYLKHAYNIKQQKYKFFKAQWSILHILTLGPRS